MEYHLALREEKLYINNPKDLIKLGELGAEGYNIVSDLDGAYLFSKLTAEGFSKQLTFEFRDTANSYIVRYNGRMIDEVYLDDGNMRVLNTRFYTAEMLNRLLGEMWTNPILDNESAFTSMLMGLIGTSLSFDGHHRKRLTAGVTHITSVETPQYGTVHVVELKDVPSTYNNEFISFAEVCDYMGNVFRGVEIDGLYFLIGHDRHLDADMRVLSKGGIQEPDISLYMAYRMTVDRAIKGMKIIRTPLGAFCNGVYIAEQGINQNAIRFLPEVVNHIKNLEYTY